MEKFSLKDLTWEYKLRGIWSFLARALDEKRDLYFF
jgi:hypothetical protein